jgi:hypothetical protein
MTDLSRLLSLFSGAKPESQDQLAIDMVTCAWIATAQLERALDQGASLSWEQRAVINSCIARLESARAKVKQREQAA